MPRYVFPGDPLVVQSPARGAPLLSAAGTRITVWQDAAGTIPADLQTLAGQPLAPTLTVDASSSLPEFLGPDDQEQLFYGVPGRPGTVGVLRRANQGPPGPQGPQGPASSTVAGSLAAVATFPQNHNGVVSKAQHWLRLGTVTLTTRYADWNGRLHLLAAGSGAPVSSFLTVVVRVKQQAEFGQAPVMSATVVEAHRHVSTDVALVPVEQTGSGSVGRTVVDVYFRNTANTFEGYGLFQHAVHLTGGAGTTMVYRTGATINDYLADLPVGVSATVLSTRLPAFT